ncbi:hypothetical protein M3Y96_00591200 [Aphelenchoides besseyi]|nr:hypothetical protein M3Y96_00591200 [Aphelenchoides besseyi]
MNVSFCDYTVEEQLIASVRIVVYSIFTYSLFFLYLRLIYILLTRKADYSGIFYRLLILNGCTNCVLFICLNIVGKYPLLSIYFGWEDPYESARWKGLVIYLIYYQGVCGYIGNFFMAANRLSAFFILQSWERVWRRLFPFVVIIYYVVPFVGFIEMLAADGLFYANCNEFAPWFDFYAIHQDPLLTEWIDGDVMASIFDITLIPTCLMLNVATIITLIVRQHLNLQMDKYTTNLIFMCLCDFFCHLLIVFATDPSNSRSQMIKRFFAIYMWSLDTIVMIPYLSVMICSQKLRSDVFFNFKRNSNALFVSRHATSSARFEM